LTKEHNAHISNSKSWRISSNIATIIPSYE